ncbi:hypothetical protein PG984_002895 [Apiospora sp. TS-2023a]
MSVPTPKPRARYALGGGLRTQVQRQRVHPSGDQFPVEGLVVDHKRKSSTLLVIVVVSISKPPWMHIGHHATALVIGGPVLVVQDRDCGGHDGDAVAVDGVGFKRCQGFQEWLASVLAIVVAGSLSEGHVGFDEACHDARLDHEIPVQGRVCGMLLEELDQGMVYQGCEDRLGGIVAEAAPGSVQAGQLVDSQRINGQRDMGRAQNKWLRDQTSVHAVLEVLVVLAGAAKIGVGGRLETDRAVVVALDLLDEVAAHLVARDQRRETLLLHRGKCNELNPLGRTVVEVHVGARRSTAAGTKEIAALGAETDERDLAHGGPGLGRLVEGVWDGGAGQEFDLDEVPVAVDKGSVELVRPSGNDGVHFLDGEGDGVLGGAHLCIGFLGLLEPLLDCVQLDRGCGILRRLV